MELVTRTLTSGAEMPVLGLGVWQLADGHETEQAVEWALEAGYRLIDTAAMYRNERSVGAAVRRSPKPRKSRKKQLYDWYLYCPNCNATYDVTGQVSQ